MAIRDGWTETTLGEIASLEYGKPLKAENRDGIGFPVLGSAGEVGRHSKPLLDVAPVIVVGRKGTAGAVWWSDLPCSVIDTAYYIVPKTSVNFNFLFLLLGFLDLPSLTAQTGVPGLNRDRAYSSEVNLPPRDEQKRIVDVVSFVDAYIDALQQQADTARSARNAVLHELLESVSTAPQKKLKDLTSKIGSGATPRGGEAVYQESGVSLIRSQNVHNGRFLHEGLVSISDSAARALDGVSVEGNDVLINITGASVARACMVDTSILPARVNQHVAILRTDSNQLLPGFLLQILLGKKMNSYLLDISGSGTTRQAITKAQLEDLEVSIPALDEQKQIVEIVSSMDDVVQSTEQAVTDAKNLRSGLLSDLLSGEHEIPESYDVFVGAA